MAEKEERILIGTDIERACENCNEWEKYDKCESLAEVALNALLSK